MNLAIRISLALASVTSMVTSCDSIPKTSVKSEGADAQSKEAINKAMRASGVLLPSGIETVDANQAYADESSARRKSGSRGIFSDIHNQGVTLLPQNQSRLKLSDDSAGDNSQVPVTDNNNNGSEPPVLPPELLPIPVNQCPEPKEACAKACATATATAYAAAYAHASATACAWAQAWACVFTVRPFNQVCSWAQSQACSSAFASAFAASTSVDTQTVCAEQCK